MNAGERAELRQIATLASVRGQIITINGTDLMVNDVEIPQGKGQRIQIPTFPNHINGTSISALNNLDLEDFCVKQNIIKAPASCKADVYINNIGYSLKYSGASPHAIVNHTARHGWERIAKVKSVNIQLLDNIITDYWNKRISGVIGEDVNNSSAASPFKDHLDTLLPYLNYFAFDGTGGRLSTAPASFVITCKDPCNIKAWELVDKDSYIKLVWPKLTFSMRSKSGVRPGTIWPKMQNGKLKGLLHVRTR